MEMCDRL